MQQDNSPVSKTVAYELRIPNVRNSKNYFELCVGLTSNATLKSLESRSNEVIAGSILTFHFSLPTSSKEFDGRVRGFEVWSVPQRDPDCHQGDYVFLGQWGEYFVFENLRFAEELQELELEQERLWDEMSY